MIGLELNFSKTCLYSSVVGKLSSSVAATTLNCAMGLLSVMYLGILISSKNPCSQDWEGLIEKVSRRLSSWKVHICPWEVGSCLLIQFYLPFQLTGCPFLDYLAESSKSLIVLEEISFGAIQTSSSDTGW